MSSNSPPAGEGRHAWTSARSLVQKSIFPFPVFFQGYVDANLRHAEGLVRFRRARAGATHSKNLLRKVRIEQTVVKGSTSFV
jgi:hypothetical protein